MHDHATCEQLLTAAQRTGRTGRAEYLSTRCDQTHAEAARAAMRADTEEAS